MTREQRDIDADVVTFLSSSSLSHSLGTEPGGAQGGTTSVRGAIISQFKSRYVDLLSEFQGWFADKTNVELVDPSTVEYLISVLQQCRESLLNPNSQISVVATTLYEAEKGLVHITPVRELKIRARRILFDLEHLHAPEYVEFKALLGSLMVQANETPTASGMDSLAARSLVQAGLAAVHRHELARIVAGDLKVQWMRALLRWSMLVLGILILTSPLTIAQTATDSWPTASWIHSFFPTDNTQLHSLVATIGTWLNSISMSGLGATGGLLSGILQIRKVRVLPARYEQDRCQSKLRPAIGAIVSMVLVIMLSWKVIPVVEQSNEGAYLLMAFLSGFSERYFSILFKMGNEADVHSSST